MLSGAAGSRHETAVEFPSVAFREGPEKILELAKAVEEIGYDELAVFDTDEAIQLLRAYWGDEKVDFTGKHYNADAIAMEPKPPQGATLPIWVGGYGPAAVRRAGQLGDGWMDELGVLYGRLRAALG